MIWAIPIKEGYPVEERPARGGVAFRFTATGSHFRNDLSISMGHSLPAGSSLRSTWLPREAAATCLIAGSR